MATTEELSKNELTDVKGGGWRDAVNRGIDAANGWLADHHLPVEIPHI